MVRWCRQSVVVVVVVVVVVDHSLSPQPFEAEWSGGVDNLKSKPHEDGTEPV